jgi:hypothetical protein
MAGVPSTGTDPTEFVPTVCTCHVVAALALPDTDTAPRTRSDGAKTTKRPFPVHVRGINTVILILLPATKPEAVRGSTALKAADRLARGTCKRLVGRLTENEFTALSAGAPARIGLSFVLQHHTNRQCEQK